MHFLNTVKSESGMAMLVAVCVLCVLTLVGYAATTSTTIDLNIAANERDFVKGFYVADRGWKQGVNWLDGLAVPPSKVNTTGNEVRNFADGDTDVTNDTFPDGSKDGVLDGMFYWYNMTYEFDEVEPGSGKAYRQFAYSVRSVAEKSQEIEVRLTKVFKVGY